jgi:type VI secretion system protein ImpJ
MSWHNKVIWSEGMFLRPQHFQQHDRYLQNLIEGRAAYLRAYSWGFTELQLDEPMLALGKVAIASARGVMPDGTPFAIPRDDEPPLPLEVPEDSKNSLVMLALPLRRVGMDEVDSTDRPDNLARYHPHEYEVHDSNGGTDSSALMQVGRLRLRLMLDRDTVSAYNCLGVARVVELRADKKVVLEDAFIPPCLDCRVSPQLTGFVKELLGLLHHRGEAIASRVSQPGRGGVAEIADFLLLQVVNRSEPLFAHLDQLSGLHPEAFYQIGLQLAGELASFTHANKRPSSYPSYQHEDLKRTFTPLMEDLRRSLSMVIEQNAVAIPLEERKFGIRVAVIKDRALLKSATFVLAANARVAQEVIRTRFPTQVKLGPVEKIRDLVNLALPGIGLHPLPVAPRQIPYHAGFVYFELDRHSDYWKQLETSGGFAMQVAGEFPGLELEFWAIRR